MGLLKRQNKYLLAGISHVERNGVGTVYKDYTFNI
jgi:hypothetical protein